jgi:hypothetical protein
VRRVFFDENLPRPLRRDLPEFTIRTAGEMGWAGIQNGKLLRLVALEFDAFLTGDRNIPHQQNLAEFRVGMVILAIGSIKLNDLRQYVPAIREALLTVLPGQIIHVTPP